MKKNTDDIEVINTTRDDRNVIWELFEQAMKLQGKNGYKVWDSIDKTALEKDIVSNLQYKITKADDLLCIFSIQLSDPLIWRERDQSDAIYLHRIVVNPAFKGQRQFEKVLHWAIQYAHSNHLKFVRMDTWADNEKIIDYYKSYGFVHIGNHQTPDDPRLPLQNRNLNVALLELALQGDTSF